MPWQMCRGPNFALIGESLAETARTAETPADGDAGVAGRIAVGIAGRSGGAGFGEAPGRVQPLADEFGRERRPRFGGGTDAGPLFLGRGQEGLARRARVDHRAAHEVGRG